MKAMLTRKLFGKIPVWIVLVVVMGVSYYFWRKKRAQGITGSAKENEAAGANSDGTSPFPYSSPDMFPLQGPGGPQGPVGPAGPSGSASGTAAGMRPVVATRSGMLAYLRKRYPGRTSSFYTQEASRRLTTERRAAATYDQRVGNTPAYNTPIGVPNSL